MDIDDKLDTIRLNKERCNIQLNARVTGDILRQLDEISKMVPNMSKNHIVVSILQATLPAIKSQIKDNRIMDLTGIKFVI